MRFFELDAFYVDTGSLLQGTFDNDPAEELMLEFTSMTLWEREGMTYSGLTYDLTLAEALIHPFDWIREEALYFKDNWLTDQVIVSQRTVRQLGLDHNQYLWNEDTKRMLFG
jgi:hypothetical protein